MAKIKQRILRNFIQDLSIKDIVNEDKAYSLKALFMRDRKKDPKHIKDTYAATFCAAQNITYRGMKRPFLARGPIMNLLQTPGDLAYQLMTLSLNEDDNIPLEERLITKLPLLNELSIVERDIQSQALAEKNSAKIDVNFVQAFKKLGQSPNFFDLSNAGNIISQALLGFFLTFSLSYKDKTAEERKKDNVDLTALYLSHDITIDSKLRLTFSSRFNPRLAKIISLKTNSLEVITLELGKFASLFDGEIEVVYKMDLTDGEKPEAVLHKIVFSKDSSEEFIAAVEILFYGNDIFDIVKIIDDEENPIKNKNFLAKMKFLQNFISAKKQIAQEKNIHPYKLDLSDPKIRQSIKTRIFAFSMGVDLSAFTKKNGSTNQDIPSDFEDDVSVYSLDDEIPCSLELPKKTTEDTLSLGSSTITVASLDTTVVNVENPKSTNFEFDIAQSTASVVTENSNTTYQLIDGEVTDGKSPSINTGDIASSSPPVALLYDITRSRNNSIAFPNSSPNPLLKNAAPNNFTTDFIRLSKEAATQYLDMFKWEPGNRRKVIWKKINPINHHGKHGRERAQKISDAQESAAILGIMKESLLSGNKDEQSLNGYLVEKLHVLKHGMEKKSIQDDLTELIAFIEEQVLPLGEKVKNGSFMSSHS